jgi:hypothetical protein
MTDSNRPPAFKLPTASPRPLLFLFFGHGDYVVAWSAPDAARRWHEHFDESCSGNDFVQLRDDAEVELYLDKDTTSDCASILGIMTLGEIDAAGGPTEVLPDSCSARELVDRFGPGYLASTTED